MAAAVLFRRRERRISRAPPPTPIATGRGTRSAVVDDRMLVEYLESSLRVPELTLPESHFPSRSPRRIPDEIGFGSLVARDEEEARRVVEAAAGVGAVRIDGAVSAEEARAVIEMVRGVFGVAGERRHGMERWFRRRDGLGLQFYWSRSISEQDDAALREVWPDSYGAIRDNVEDLASKLELVAECIAKILSEQIRDQNPYEAIGKKETVLCLKKYDESNQFQFNQCKDHHSHALSLHLSDEDQEFFIRSEAGSTSFSLPAGSILIAIRKELEEWTNAELRSAIIEPLIDPSNDDKHASFSLEFMCSPLALNYVLNHRTKTLSLMDQLLVLLVLLFLYRLWAFISSRLLGHSSYRIVYDL